MIKFQGLLGRTFGGFLTIRGTAKFSDIVKYSEAKEYQRKTIPEHLIEIGKYYNEPNNIFFPEVILSLELEYDFEQTDASGINPVVDISNGVGFRSNINDIVVNVLKKRHTNDKLQVANILFNDNSVKKFGRIDGNHRLTVEDSDSINPKEIPFCIILFEQRTIEKDEKMLFFNINSKARPLKTEEILRAIFTDDDNFNNELLKNNSSFGWEYYFTKQMKETNINLFFSNLKLLLNGKFLTTFLKLFKLLLDNGVIQKIDNDINKVIEALSYVNSSIYNELLFKNSNNTSIFSAFLYYQLKAPELINFLKDWVIKNEIYQIEELEPNSIIKIMNNIASHKVKKIFVAMPYWSHAKVTEYNKLFKEALSEIKESEDLPFTLELFPIMRHSGESQRIDERLLNQIRECDIFIAELTGANENVLYETAFAEGQGKQSLLIKDENDVDENGNEITLPFDMDKRQYVPYQKDTYYNTIKSIVKNNLPKMLKR